MSASVSLIGGAFLAVILAGYVAQRYLPPPTPKIIGIDLGTTYSSVAVYHAVTGDVEVISDDKGRKAIPSVVAILQNGSVLVGHDAVAQSDHNPSKTYYDAKRFIGKKFFDELEFRKEIARYPFEIVLKNDQAFFMCPPDRLISPEEIGSYILKHLKEMTERQLSTKIFKAVMTAPAEFDDLQRNTTVKSAGLAGLEVLRVINEPTAAALAYGLHKKEGVEYIMIVDLGGGTLDVSLLLIQGGMFITVAMAGNNHLGGQDFNQRMLAHLLNVVEQKFGQGLTDKEDIQTLRSAVETAKLELTNVTDTTINVEFFSLNDPKTNSNSLKFVYTMSRQEFEFLNEDLFKQILKPITAVLFDADLKKEDVDEIVLVGGSTRIPKIRKYISDFFQKSPNYGVDPELAVVTGVAVQAGVLGGGWPLQVAATELPSKLKKIHVYTED